MLVLLTAVFGVWEKSELGFYDTWFNLRGREDPGRDIVIIAEDEKSMSELGPLPWPRSLHARLLRELRDARVVGFDLLFDAPKDKASDTAFADAVAGHGGVVLASMFAFEESPQGPVEQLKMPLEQVAAGCAGIGFVNVPTEKGNTVRRVTVIDTNHFDVPYPSFSLAVAMAAEGATPDDLKLRDGLLRAGKLEIPLNKDSQVLIDFWGPKGAFPTYSYADVLNGKFAPGFWKGKIVLVGVSSPMEKDNYENPFTRGNLVLAGALPPPGVEIHASAVKTYLTGRYFQRALWPVNLAVLVLVWAITALAVRRRSPWTGLVFALLLAAGLLAAVYLVWLTEHYWLNAMAPVIMVATTYVGTTVESFVRTELERRRTKALFGRYLSATVVDELLRNKEEIELGGVKREVTVLFSDIRGFTSFSEGRAPEEVVARLNEYFTAMTEEVFKQGGTLDKYLGDGLMAIFGAPVSYPDHARRALAASVGMLKRLEGLNREWQERGQVTLEVGIGVNSGSVVVGNIGSPDRMDYTVIGEEVNLASRLEGMNKEYKTQIILSERTARLLREGDLPPGWVLKSLGEAKVRGMAEPVQIYTLVRGEDF